MLTAARLRVNAFQWISLSILTLGIVVALIFVPSAPQLIVNGIRYGSMLMLGGIGLTLTYKILNFSNFAHADLMALGAFIALLFNGTLGLPLEAAFFITILLTPWVAIAIDQILYKRMRKSNAIVLVIASFGIALFLRNLTQALWGSNYQSYRFFLAGSLQLPFDIIIRLDQIIMIVMAFVLVGFLQIFLKYTRTGKAMRATSDNANLALVSGINTEQIVRWTWGIGGALAAAGGVFFGLDFGLKADMGNLIILPLFAAVILGGIGSPLGAAAGSLIIGVTQNLLVAPATPIPASYKVAISFVFMILILLLRPQGLFGGGERSA
jgi:branched-chain amino acid transport system permease protein/neutral amino acid transport system permease protein